MSINNMQALGKFLDQPMLVSKFQQSVPFVLGGTTLTYTSVNTAKAPKRKKKDEFIRTGFTLGAAALSAAIAPKIASRIAKRELPKTLKEIQENNVKLVDEFIKSNSVEESTKDILNKSKDKILSKKEIKVLFENLSKNEKGKEFLEKLIPSPKNITAKDIFSEIGYLSVFGAVPVAGGIAGGITGDIVRNKKNWREKVPNKIKEGSYQYLANIFMCNVGAGAALGILEKAGIKSKAARAIGMTAGIITTGIIGGSKIANLIGKKVIDPICKNCDKNKKDRTPELLDIGLHTDDIATVSLLSGLKWIEPALPLMYTISGYRAGIGYRN